MATPVLPRKKGTGLKTWLLLNSVGQNQVIEAGKYSIMRRTSLPARDLRVLDPLLSYPSAVFCREKAIVVNLEYIKAIIMAKEVLLLNFKDPFVEPFVQELERRILCYYQATKEQEESEFDRNQLNDGKPEEPEQHLASSKKNLEGSAEFQENESKAERKQSFRKKTESLTVLPFEFIALEACLEATCTSLDNEAKTLEEEAHPVLDKLTSQISTLNLERVRQMKSRLVAIVGRVQKVRDELEHLLDDDGDMREMHLTYKLYQRYLEDSSTASSSDEGIYDGLPDMDDRIVPPEILPESYGASTSYQEIENISQKKDDDRAEDGLFSGCGRDSQRNNGGVRTKESNIGELEMLLEAYFVQIEGTLNKLTTLREYVDDTEDYINIMLDEKQNQLLQMGVMLTTATMLLSVSIVLAGILGMNVRIELFKIDVQQGMPKWLWTTCATNFGIIILYALAIAFYKFKGYID